MKPLFPTAKKSTKPNPTGATMTLAIQRQTTYTNNLQDALEDLIDYVMGYEDHLFSASNSEMSREEAESIAAQLIQRRCYYPSYESEGETLVNLLSTLRYGGGF